MDIWVVHIYWDSKVGGSEAPHMSDLVKEVTKGKKNFRNKSRFHNKEHGDPNFVQHPHSSHSDNDKCSLYFDEETSKRNENATN